MKYLTPGNEVGHLTNLRESLTFEVPGGTYISG